MDGLHDIKDEDIKQRIERHVGDVPTFKHIADYGMNSVWEIYMPDGNSFRYTWGEMIPLDVGRNTGFRR